MNFDLTEEQVLLKNMVERFVADCYDLDRRRAYAAAPLGFSTENWALLGELGLLALPFSADLGGLGGGSVELITTMEALGRGLVVEPVLSQVLVTGGLIQRAGNEAQKAELLPAIMAGERHIALAHSEVSARYNLNHVETCATVEDDTVRLDGEKTFVLGADAADLLIVSARSATSPSNVEFYLVPADAAGLSRHIYRLADGTHAAQIILQGVRVSKADRLDGGVEALADTITTARLGACGEMLGVMSTMFNDTLEYLRTRRQFGTAIGSFQALQHRMAHLYLLLEQSRSLVYGAALADEASRSTRIAGAKAYVSDAALRLGHECIQFHGGMGVSDELPIGHGHKRLMVLATLFGDAETTLEEFIRQEAS